MTATSSSSSAPSPSPTLDGDADDTDRTIAARGRIKSFREDTRERRIEIARELEHLSGRKVSWGVRVGETEALFTHLAAPVMTRLRQPERQVLDTLVEAGVAKSRSEALAWCVKLVGEKSDSWLGELREAMAQVDEVRKKGPGRLTGIARGEVCRGRRLRGIPAGRVRPRRT